MTKKEAKLSLRVQRNVDPDLLKRIEAEVQEQMPEVVQALRKQGFYVRSLEITLNFERWSLTPKQLEEEDASDI